MKKTIIILFVAFLLIPLCSNAQKGEPLSIPANNSADIDGGVNLHRRCYLWRDNCTKALASFQNATDEMNNLSLDGIVVITKKCEYNTAICSGGYDYFLEVKAFSF